MKDLLKQFYNSNSPARAVNLPKETKQKIKFSLLSKIANMEKNNMPQQSGFPWINLKTLFLKSYVVLPLALLFLIGGSAIASANALPGDTLYPVKRGVEKVSVLIAPTEKEKTELKVKFAKKRIAELETLKQRGAIIQTSNKPKDDGNPTAKPKDDDTKVSSDDNGRSKFKSPRGNSQLTPAIQKQIEDDAEEAHRLLDDNQRRIEREREDERENEEEGLDEGFRIQQEDSHLKTNSDLKIETRN